jgi:hypothetical protein
MGPQVRVIHANLGIIAAGIAGGNASDLEKKGVSRGHRTCIKCPHPGTVEKQRERSKGKDHDAHAVNVQRKDEEWEAGEAHDGSADVGVPGGGGNGLAEVAIHGMDGRTQGSPLHGCRR